MAECKNRLYTLLMSIDFSKREVVKGLDLVAQFITSPVAIHLPVPVNVEGEVSRGRSRTPEKIILSANGGTKCFFRNCPRNLDGLDVSCSSEGEKVPVDSINIAFRAQDDPFTDRGIVWIIPGVSTTACVAITPAAFSRGFEFVKDIVVAAEAAMQDAVFKHFPPDAQAAPQ